MLGQTGDLYVGIHERDTYGDHLYSLTVRNLGVYTALKRSPKVPGGRNRRGMAARVGWKEQRLVYDNNVLDDPRYAFYRGWRAYRALDTDRRADSHLPTSLEIYGLDRRIYFGAALETNLLYTPPIDAAHVLTFVINAQTGIHTRSVFSELPARFVERPALTSPGMTEWVSPIRGAAASGAIASPQMNLGILTKNEILSLVMGYVGEYTMSPGTTSLAGERYEYFYQLHSAFFSLKWDVLSLKASLTTRVGHLHLTRDTAVSEVFRDHFANARMVFRPLELLLAHRKVPPLWRSAVALYEDFLFSNSPPMDADPTSRALSKVKERLNIAGIAAALPFWPFTEEVRNTATWVTEALLDLQAITPQSDVGIAAMLGLRLRPAID
jgi:hypothetical protein